MPATVELGTTTQQHTIARLRRAAGQLGGVATMIEERRSCDDIVTQLAAVSKAVNAAAFTLIGDIMSECLSGTQDEDSEATLARLRQLFLRLA
jgi:DNA-binding FrmR family transcriptional regulator